MPHLRTPLILLLGCLIVVWSPVQARDWLESISTIKEHTTHRASSADPDGGNDDNIQSFAPGETAVLMDVEGSGRITHFWLTLAAFHRHANPLQDLVLRMTWDGAESASVETPLGAFFGQWHGVVVPFESTAVAVGQNAMAFNAYWPMPFRRRARIEILNRGERSIRRIYYQIDYEKGPGSADEGYFHAAFHQAKSTVPQAGEGNLSGTGNYLILETEGRGQYAGCFFFVESEGKEWWGEGDDMIFIDHASEPTLKGTGSEDYFGNAWGYDGAFSYPFYGAPFFQRGDWGSRVTLYRWHVPDPVRFSKHVRVTMETTWNSKMRNDFASLAFWYQEKPAPVPVLPAVQDLQPRNAVLSQPAEKEEWAGVEFESALRRAGYAARSITGNSGEGFRKGGYLRIETEGKPVNLDIPVPVEGRYRVAIRPVNSLLEEPTKVRLGQGVELPIQRSGAHQRDRAYTEVGVGLSQDNRLSLTFTGGPVIGVDAIQVERVSE